MSELLELLSDDSLKADAALQPFKSVDDLAKSYVQTKALVGKKGVILPGEGADEKEWEPVYNQLGRPEKPDAYKVPNIQLPKGQNIRPEMLKEFNEFAHKAGLTQKQYEKALAWRIQTELGEFEAHSKAQAEAEAAAETELRTAWKDKYDTNQAAIEKLVKTFGKDKADAVMQKFGKDPLFKSFIGELLPNFNEAAMEVAGYRPGDTTSPEAAKAKIFEIRNDAKHPHNVDGHPNHKEALEEMAKLYQIAYPGKRKI